MLDIYFILSILSFLVAKSLPKDQKDHEGVMMMIAASLCYLISLYTALVAATSAFDNITYFW